MGSFFSSIGKYIGDAFNSFNPVSAIVSGGLGMLGSNIQNNHNANMMREQMKFHQQEREASQQFQTSERLAQQAYQTGERNAQNIWQESMYGKYQSPEAMVRQYNEAGINGRLAASGQAGMGSMSVSGGSNGGAPSSGAPSGSHVNPPYQNISAWSAGFESIAKSLHTLSETKKNGIETTYLEDRLKEELKQSRIKSALMDIDFDVQKLTARPMAQAALDKLMAEAKKENLNLSVINKQLEILENQRIITKADADAAKERVRLELLKYSSEINAIDVKADLDKETINLVKEQAKTQSTTRNLQISQSALNRTMSTYYSSLKDLTDSQKLSEDERRELTRSEIRLKDLERRYQGATLSERIQTTQQMAEEMQNQIALLKEKIQEAKNRNDWNDVIMYTELLNSAEGGVRLFNSLTPKRAPKH